MDDRTYLADTLDEVEGEAHSMLLAKTLTAEGTSVNDFIEQIRGLAGQARDRARSGHDEEQFAVWVEMAAVCVLRAAHLRSLLDVAAPNQGAATDESTGDGQAGGRDEAGVEPSPQAAEDAAQEEARGG